MTEKLPVVAILGGTGKEGPGLALRWANAGYAIIIGSRQQEKAEATAADLNARLGIGTIRGMQNRDAVLAADLCVLTVVQSAHGSALEGLKDVLQGKILIDATARVEFGNPKPPVAPSAGRMAQDILGPGVKVAAAFQNVPAHALKKNLDETLDTDVLVCADDAEAAEVAINLAQAGGMRAYYAGDLDNAIVVEGLTSLLIQINKKYQTKTASIIIRGVPGVSKG